MEATVQDLRETINNNTAPKTLRLPKTKSMEARKFFEIEHAPKACLRHLLRTLVELTYLLNHCIWLSHFPSSEHEGKTINFLRIYVLSIMNIIS